MTTSNKAPAGANGATPVDERDTHTHLSASQAADSTSARKPSRRKQADENGFTTMPGWVREICVNFGRKHAGNASLVYWSLRSRARTVGGVVQIGWPGVRYETVAGDCGLSERTVYRYVSLLARAGAIRRLSSQRQEDRRGQNRQGATRYIFPASPPFQTDTRDRLESSQTDTGDSEGVTPVSYIPDRVEPDVLRNSVKIPSLSEGTFTKKPPLADERRPAGASFSSSPSGNGAAALQHGLADFEKFWAAYPRKEKKPKALTAWKRVTNRPPVDELIKKVEMAKRTEAWRRENGRFIPLPCSWIEDRRWEDEIIPAYLSPEEIEAAQRQRDRERLARLKEDRELREGRPSTEVQGAGRHKSPEQIEAEYKAREAERLRLIREERARREGKASPSREEFDRQQQESEERKRRRSVEVSEMRRREAAGRNVNMALRQLGTNSNAIGTPVQSKEPQNLEEAKARIRETARNLLAQEEQLLRERPQPVG